MIVLELDDDDDDVIAVDDVVVANDDADAKGNSKANDNTTVNLKQDGVIDEIAMMADEQSSIDSRPYPDGQWYSN